MATNFEVILQDLREYSGELNHLTDQINTGLREIEDFLEDLSIGTNITGRVFSTSVPPQRLIGSAGYVHCRLCYGRLGNRSRIYVWVSGFESRPTFKSVPVAEVYTPWDQTHRDLRVEMVYELLPLLQGMNSTIQDRILQIRRAQSLIERSADLLGFDSCIRQPPEPDKE